MYKKTRKEFKVGDKIQFVAQNGLFYSCKRLSRNKTYEIVYITNGSYDSSYSIEVINDIGKEERICSEMFDDLMLMREEKLKNLLDNLDK